MARQNLTTLGGDNTVSMYLAEDLDALQRVHPSYSKAQRYAYVHFKYTPMLGRLVHLI